eukprot:PLAT9458.4.p1 GENE.PLAT9458.4~~PLAT9458.4.p1  ORF type:complete len:140 (-),score=35.75 PLAT9458.4:54-473(-)
MYTAELRPYKREGVVLHAIYLGMSFSAVENVIALLHPKLPSLAAAALQRATAPSALHLIASAWLGVRLMRPGRSPAVCVLPVAAQHAIFDCAALLAGLHSQSAAVVASSLTLVPAAITVAWSARHWMRSVEKGTDWDDE